MCPCPYSLWLPPMAQNKNVFSALKENFHAVLLFHFCLLSDRKRKQRFTFGYVQNKKTPLENPWQAETMASKVPKSRSRHLLVLPTGKYCLTVEEEIRGGPWAFLSLVSGLVPLYTPASLNSDFIVVDKVISKGMSALSISSVETNHAWEGDGNS